MEKLPKIKKTEYSSWTSEYYSSTPGQHTDKEIVSVEYEPLTRATKYPALGIANNLLFVDFKGNTYM